MWTEYPEVLSQAWDEARARNHPWVGVEHVLLALARQLERGNGDGGRILRLAGASPAAIRIAVGEKQWRGPRELEKRYPTGWDDVRATPALHRLHGRAEGLAIGLGLPEGSDVAVLLALVWEPLNGELLTTSGITAGAVLGILSAEGLTLPPTNPPPPVELRWSKPVYVGLGDLERVLRELPSRMPEGARFGFNYDADRAWFHATEGVALEGLIGTITEGQ